MMKTHNKSLLALILLGLFGLSACGSDGKDGADGAPGTPGADGQDGQDGQPAGVVVSTIYQAGDVSFTIDPADNTLAGSNTFALKFQVSAKDQAGQEKPLSGLNQVAIYSVTAMSNATSDGPSVYWQNNAKAAGNGTSMYCTLDGTYSSRGTTGDACTLVEDPANPGTYTGTWEHDGSAPIMYADDDLSAPHRIMLRVYNLKDADGNSISGKVLSTPLDYIPATGETVDTTGKDTVADAACKQCHGESTTTGNIANIGAHGNYQSVKNCIACHNPATQPSAEDAAEGYVFDLPAMIHRIHGGEHLAALAQYGFKQAEEWAEIAYPSPLDNCTKCHSTDEGKTTWKDEPTRVSCGGCHSNINFATGEGHSDFNLAQADDAQCVACHGTGALSPMEAHKVGERAEYASLVNIDFTGASVAGDAGAKVLTVTADVMVNGALSSDLSVLGVTNTLMGNVDSKGEIHRWGSRPALTSGNFDAGTGKLTLTQSISDAQAMGTLYVGTEATFCVDKTGKAATCDEKADLAYGNPVASVHGRDVFSTAIGVTTQTKFFDLDTAAADDEGVPARFTVPERITVAESKCEACHTSLDITKGASHGVYTFDQCMDCHNNDYAGSYHPNAVYKDADGNAVSSGVTFTNRDLVTVTHRFHSGNFDVIEGIYKDAKGNVMGYPGVSNDCSACHKEGATFFAADGGLTSGKRAIAVTGGFISPVAESCRSCHTSDAALAHFQSNGATTTDAPDTTADLPVESCATCHAEGKSFGIDKFHTIK
ncbi:OmcA/MtrC family decaheme c-type cytochrome [Shewanella sp. YIC-542]|uniref:OmcA/MtrC family decaheme c-type cytochrome n=1 Tax=Shewanella mytili TaxID=3377111 RepID=UPI00398F4A60